MRPPTKHGNPDDCPQRTPVSGFDSRHASSPLILNAKAGQSTA